MRIHLITVGTRLATWVNQGYDEYSRRMPAEVSLNLIEIPVARRGKNADIARLMDDEGKRMLAAIPKGAAVIALDEGGRQWSTRQLAQQLDQWMQDVRDLALLVGGPDGLAPACRERAATSWSLSSLTLPHPLVRIVVAEQLYRAWTILNHHPYHRD